MHLKYWLEEFGQVDRADLVAETGVGSRIYVVKMIDLRQVVVEFSPQETMGLEPDELKRLAFNKLAEALEENKPYPRPLSHKEERGERQESRRLRRNMATGKASAEAGYVTGVGETMTLYEVTNGWTGESYVRVYAWAKNEEEALELARNSFKDHAAQRRYPESYYSELKVVRLFNSADSSFATWASDSGFDLPINTSPQIHRGAAG